MLAPIRLRPVASPHFAGAALLLGGGTGAPAAPARPVVVGTLRMGYGHLRMARAAASWAPALGAQALIQDPLALDALESRLLSAGERAYSACSRLSASLGGRIERAWGRLMLSGGKSSAESSRALMRRLVRLAGDLPRHWPVVAAHPWNARLALEAGFTRVINLVPDSHPQPFLLVEEALNLTQNESSLRAALALGLPPERAAVAGHWVPEELADNAERDSALRLERLRSGRPVRLLLSMGGAGAQAAYYERLIEGLAGLARRGRLRLLINAGDHPRVAARLRGALAAAGLRWESLASPGALDELLARRGLGGEELEAEAALLETGEPLEAVAATDRLMRAADVLVTKPSELAFFPLPKLHIRRVGDHEAAGAECSARLGDGTRELREPAEAVERVERWCAGDAELARLDEGVTAAARRGVYHGARAALERALGS